MNIRLLHMLALCVITGVALSACSATPNESQTAPENTASPTAIAESPATAMEGLLMESGLQSGDLVVAAKAIPTYSVELSFPQSGTVSKILVEEGDYVRAGDPLIQLDTEGLQLRLEDVQATLAEVKAAYEKLLEGASEEQIAQAQARIERVRSQFNVTESSITADDIEAAHSELERARLHREQLLNGPKTEDIERTQARLDQAEAELEAVRSRWASDKTQAESRIIQTANDLRTQQDLYSRVYWKNRELEQADSLTPDRIDREAEELRTVQNLEEKLQQARVEYEEIRQREIAEVELAEAKMRVAQLNLQELLNPPDADVVASVNAEVAEAQARLSGLLGEEREARLEAALAVVAEAQASYDELVADPRQTDIATLEARLLRAEVDVKLVTLALEQSTLLAPSAGTVVALRVEEGQLIGTGKTVVLLADLSSWQVQSEDLNELSIVHIREGDPVAIRFFALPDLNLTGRVSQISVVGEYTQNMGITYRVLITPDQWDERLRWNMTASVEFLYDQ